MPDHNYHARGQTWTLTEADRVEITVKGKPTLLGYNHYRAWAAALGR